MLFSVVLLLLSCTWTEASAGNDSSALNVTETDGSTNTTARVPMAILSYLPKSIRTKANHTAPTTTTHPKVKDTNVVFKHNKLMNWGTTMASKLGGTPAVSATVRNTSLTKNGDHRSNSSRLLDRFASISKVSLASLMSSKVSSASNETSTLSKESVPVNVSLTKVKNIADRAESTIVKRSVHNSSVVDRATLFFQSLPVTLVNTTSNVTSWVKRLFTGNNSALNTTTKKATRDTSAAELKFLVNSTDLKKSSVNSTVEEGEQSHGAKRIDGEEKHSLGDSSSVLNLTSDTIKRDDGNLTAGVPTLKEITTPLPGITVDDDFALAKLNSEITEEAENASIMIAELSDAPKNRTRRHYNPPRYGRPPLPYYMKSTTTTTRAPSYQGYTTRAPFLNAAPAYGTPLASDGASVHGMAPAAAVPAYGMTLAPTLAPAPAPAAAPAPNPAYGVVPTPTPAAPVYGAAATPAPVLAAPAYGIAPSDAATPTYGMTPAPAPAAPAYGMAPFAASSYGMAPAPASPSYGIAPAFPSYGMAPAPAFPSYGMAPAPAFSSYGMAPAPASTPASTPVSPSYGMAPAPAFSGYGMVPAPAFSGYGIAPASAFSGYGMAPAPASPSYGMAPAPAANSSYGMAPAPAFSGYGMAPASPSYGMAPAPASPSYGMAPAPASPSYGMAPAANSSYGMVPASSSYGMAPAPAPAPSSYGMPSASAAPSYGIDPTPAAPAYGMVATMPSYDLQTESYYTAPQPMYTTYAPHSAPTTTAKYAPPPVGYPPQPYGGSMPSRPSASWSPWL